MFQTPNVPRTLRLPLTITSGIEQSVDSEMKIEQYTHAAKPDKFSRNHYIQM